jgi:radical SAM protein with 4Fe4S-binding SPASM domain
MHVVAQRMMLRAMAERIPYNASIEIIATCNFACGHCYIAPTAERHDVMPLESAERILDMLERAGTLYLLLTGGEPLTHRQFREIYLAGVRRGFLMQLNSNGYLIGERWADFLAEHPPTVVSISVYGMSDEDYLRVTGIPNAWRRVERAVDLLRERGIHLDLKCPAMTTTAATMPAIARWCADRGVTMRYDVTMIAEDKGSVAPLGFQLTADQVAALDAAVDPGFATMRSEYPTKVPVAPSDSVYRCGGGRANIHIGVHGDVFTCTTSRRPAANLLRDGWDYAWAALGGKVAVKFPVGHPCATCGFRGICVGCPATAESVTGLPTGYVQAHCRITHRRAYNAGLHPTGVPRTVTEGIPPHIPTPGAAASRALPVIS